MLFAGTCFFITLCKAEANCMDTDNGATDSNGESCAYWYRWYPKDCGLYDDDDFTAKTMCCACKGICHFYDIDQGSNNLNEFIR